MVLQVMGTAHCASDPVIKKVSNHKMRAEVPVYIKDVWTDQHTGEIKEVQDNFRCVFWGENARRAEQLLMKGSQIIITGAKLRVVKHPNNQKLYFTQIWVDRWEVPTKVLMTKSLYQDIYQSELLPYKIFVFQASDNTYGIELHIDKKTMVDYMKGYLKESAQFAIILQHKNDALFHCVIDHRHLKLSNHYCDTYGIANIPNDTILKADRIYTKLMINQKIMVEHAFDIKACLHSPLE